MLRLSLAALTLLFSVNVSAGVHGPCKIESMEQSDSYADLMLVTMECDGTDLPTTCTNMVSNQVVYDATGEVGNFRTSMLLAAFMAEREVRISSWGTCPPEVNSVPLVYGIRVE